jgi:hypothetical protein
MGTERRISIDRMKQTTYDHFTLPQSRLDRYLGPVRGDGGVSDLFRGGDGHLRAAAVVVEVRGVVVIEERRRRGTKTKTKQTTNEISSPSPN